jgi:putative solute:sodium symporter small subunit
MRSLSLSDLATALPDLERRLGVARLKRAIVTMLAGWIAYFHLINVFADSLNKLRVPVLHLPLHLLLAMQGVVVIFVIALYFIMKQQRATSALVRIGRKRA